MRILIIANTRVALETGSGYVIRGFEQGLKARGHSVDVYDPAAYEPLRRWRRAIQYRQVIGMALKARRVLRRERFDVVEFYGAEAWLALTLLRRRARREFLLVLHSNGLESHAALCTKAAVAGSPDTTDLQLDPRDRLFDRAFSLPDGLVAVSEFDAAFARSRSYLPATRIVAIENPLPSSYLGLQLATDRPPHVGFCGSWLERKGTALLSNDLPPFLRANPEWRLTLVGVGEGFVAGDHFPRDVLPRIRVIPHADREGWLRDLYRGFAVLVMPSHYESFGLVAAEAMACGCAVVATKVGFAAGLRDREEVLHIRSNGPGALLAALQAVTTDERLRQRIAVGGHRRVQVLRWPEAVARLETVYEQWLGQIRLRARSDQTGLAARDGE